MRSFAICLGIRRAIVARTSMNRYRTCSASVMRNEPSGWQICRTFGIATGAVGRLACSRQQATWTIQHLEFGALRIKVAIYWPAIRADSIKRQAAASYVRAAVRLKAKLLRVPRL